MPRLSCRECPDYPMKMPSLRKCKEWGKHKRIGIFSIRGVETLKASTGPKSNHLTPSSLIVTSTFLWLHESTNNGLRPQIYAYLLIFPHIFITETLLTNSLKLSLVVKEKGSKYKKFVKSNLNFVRLCLINYLSSDVKLVNSFSLFINQNREKYNEKERSHKLASIFRKNNKR